MPYLGRYVPRTAAFFCATFVMSAACAGPSASAHQSKAVEDCYDTVVVAQIVRQTPSVAPDLGPNSLVMRWPWFLELDVKRVLLGKARKGRQVVLSVQHTNVRSDLGSVRWRLRSNTAGGFNVLDMGGDESLQRCDRNAPAAEPYLTPGPGKTLEDLQREAATHSGLDE